MFHYIRSQRLITPDFLKNEDNDEVIEERWQQKVSQPLGVPFRRVSSSPGSIEARMWARSRFGDIFCSQVNPSHGPRFIAVGKAALDDLHGVS